MENQTNNSNSTQNKVIIVSEKNSGTGIILALIFGPLGLFYSSIIGAIIMFIIAIPVAIFTLGFGFLILNPLCAIWAYIAVNNHNKKLHAGN